MTEHTTILTPIRYPLTDRSAKTLAAAGRIAYQKAPADLLVLHVNPFQSGADVQTQELTRAISSVLEDIEASVLTRRGFFIEETILAETEAIDADIVVIGADQQGRLRRFIRRVLGSEPAVGSYLEANVAADVKVIEIDSSTSISIEESELERASGPGTST